MLVRCLCKSEAFYSHYVSDVKEPLPHRVIHGFVFAGANLIPLYVNLNPSGRVLKFAERGGAHDAAAHYPACNAKIAVWPLRGVEAFGLCLLFIETLFYFCWILPDALGMMSIPSPQLGEGLRLFCSCSLNCS